MKQIRALFRYTSGLRPLMVIIAIAGVLTALLNLATPFVMKLATDWIVSIAAGNETFSMTPLLWLIGALVGLSFIGVAINDFGGHIGDMLAIRAREQLSRRYYEHLLTLPQKYFDNEITGKIINRLSRAIVASTNFFQFFANNLLSMLLTIGITIALLLFYSWPLGLLFALLIPANLYLTSLTSKKWQALETEINKDFDIASGRFTEVVGQPRLIKSFQSEVRELKLFTDRFTNMIGLTRKQSRWWHSMNALRGVVFGGIFAAMYGILFYQTATGKISVGDMVFLLTLVQQVAFPMRSLSFFVDSYQRAVANSKDYIEAMNEIPEEESSNKKLNVKKYDVAFDDVSFAYEGGEKVLRNVSFAIPAGQKLALVSESGGGKTTISNLLMRLYEPSGGMVKIGGENIADVSRASIRSNIATVFQEPALFSGTIRENIAYAKPGASSEEIEKAAKAANAHGFISKLKDGYDSEIGERGIKLSGGQKQRIAIARAILKDAPILILDEATSALDSKAEHEVQQALERLMKNRTTLIIAHRLSTIASVDEIVTLRDGRVDETGSPSELAQSGGIYSELLQLQIGSSEKAKEQLEKFDISAEA